MDKELKIAIILFLIFLVFGLASYFNQGSFASPVFLNQFVFVSVALIFLLLNLKSKDALVLWLYLIPCSLSFLLDHFTMGYLAEKFQNNTLLDFTQSSAFSIVFLIGYFGVFTLLTAYFFKLHKKVFITVIQLIILFLTVFFLLFTDNSIDQDLSFHLYLILNIVLINQFNTSNSKGLAVLSYQFLLLFLLEGLEYFL